MPQPWAQCHGKYLDTTLGNALEVILVGSHARRSDDRSLHSIAETLRRVRRAGGPGLLLGKRHTYLGARAAAQHKRAKRTVVSPFAHATARELGWVLQIQDLSEQRHHLPQLLLVLRGQQVAAGSRLAGRHMWQLPEVQAIEHGLAVVVAPTRARYPVVSHQVGSCVMPSQLPKSGHVIKD